MTPRRFATAVPNQERTRRHSIRIDDETWGALLWIADAEGTTVSAILNAFARERVRKAQADGVILDTSLAAYARRRRRGGSGTPSGTPPR